MRDGALFPAHEWGGIPCCNKSLTRDVGAAPMGRADAPAPITVKLPAVAIKETTLINKLARALEALGAA